MNSELRTNSRAGMYKYVEAPLKFSKDLTEPPFTGDRHVAYNDGTNYYVHFENSNFSGHGVLEFANGDTYIGEFKKDLPHGSGVMFFVRYGDRYQGEFSAGKRNGKGIFYKGNGESYAGEFVNNLRHHYGCFTFKNGDTYKGQYKMGYENGKAVYESRDLREAGVVPFKQAGEWHKGLEQQYHKQRPDAESSAYRDVERKVNDIYIKGANEAAERALAEAEKAEAIKNKITSENPRAQAAALRSKSSGNLPIQNLSSSITTNNNNNNNNLSSSSSVGIVTN